MKKKKVKDLKKEWKIGSYIIECNEEKELKNALKEAINSGELERKGISYTYICKEKQIILLLYKSVEIEV